MISIGSIESETMRGQMNHRCIQIAHTSSDSLHGGRSQMPLCFRSELALDGLYVEAGGWDADDLC